MRAEYARSKSWLSKAIAVNAYLYVAAILSVCYMTGWVTRLTGILAAIAQVAVFLARRASAHHYGSAERIRRIAMLKDGLGLEPSDLEVARLIDQTSGADDTEAAFIEPYYASEEQPGPRRLVDILRESAFFTSGLAKTCSLVFRGIATAGFLIVLVAFVYIAMSNIPRSALDVIAQSVVIVMAFLASGDVADMATRFGDLEKATEAVLSQCQEALVSGKADREGTALVLLGEYNCAVLGAPPIPNPIYQWRQQQLNNAWRNRVDKGCNANLVH